MNRTLDEIRRVGLEALRERLGQPGCHCWLVQQCRDCVVLERPRFVGPLALGDGAI
jgi:hypothetical protein